MDPKNKSAEQILKAKDRLQFSTWHFLQARRLLDYAKRTNSPGALHYSAFEIRYGIEELLFELLVLTKRGLNDKQYKKCIGNPNAMRKMLEHQDVTYSKLLAFTRIAMDMDARPDKPNLRYWELKELFKHWGKVSSYLHFCGPQKATYDSEQWISKALSELDEISLIFWKSATETAGFGLMAPDTMKPAAAQIWSDFKEGIITLQDVKARLEISRPITDLKKQPLTIQDKPHPYRSSIQG